MKMDANRNLRILENCDRQWWGQYQNDTILRRVWVKLTPQHIIDLLFNCASAARFDARMMLTQMETSGDKWRIRATAHEGGTGDHRGVDASLHITLKAGKFTYHLRCKETPTTLHISKITW